MRTVISKSTRACAILTCLAAFGPVAAADERDVPAQNTATPIRRVVIIFQENVSVDHYFGTYPFAANNNPTEPSFGPASSDTPSMNNLLSAGFLTGNPNSTQPFPPSRPPNYTCDQGHDYKPQHPASNSAPPPTFPPT